MIKDQITQEMRNLMDVIHEQQELVLSHQGNIPRIELDMLMENVRKLYENLYELSRLNEQPARQNLPHDEPVLPSIPAASPSSPSDRHMHTDELIANIPQDVQHIDSSVPMASTTPIASPSPEHIQPEALTAQINTPVEEPREEISSEAVLPQAALSKERVREFSKPSAKAPSTATLFDDHIPVSNKSQEAPSLYDKITAANEDKSIATKLQKNPVSDLKKSIGINEKFSFINELFDGDLNAYNEAIEKLNSSNDHITALSFLQNELIAKYNWNGESESFLKLRNLVDRRFTA